MGWILDNGEPESYRHEGYVITVDTNGTEYPGGQDTGQRTSDVSVVGWQAACACESVSYTHLRAHET